MRNRFARLGLESLEDRAVPAIFTWAGDGGTNLWTTPGCWRVNGAPATTTPTRNDDVLFMDTANNCTVPLGTIATAGKMTAASVFPYLGTLRLIGELDLGHSDGSFSLCLWDSGHIDFPNSFTGSLHFNKGVDFGWDKGNIGASDHGAVADGSDEGWIYVDPGAIFHVQLGARFLGANVRLAKSTVLGTDGAHMIMDNSLTGNMNLSQGCKIYIDGDSGNLLAAGTLSFTREVTGPGWYGGIVCGTKSPWVENHGVISFLEQQYHANEWTTFGVPLYNYGRVTVGPPATTAFTGSARTSSAYDFYNYGYFVQQGNIQLESGLYQDGNSLYEVWDGADVLGDVYIISGSLYFEGPQSTGTSDFTVSGSLWLGPDGATLRLWKDINGDIQYDKIICGTLVLWTDSTLYLHTSVPASDPALLGPYTLIDTNTRNGNFTAYSIPSGYYVDDSTADIKLGVLV